ncbi:MAG: D-alanine--D-alanine ligase [Oscillospiraceae bacterium]|nr:D-alanine--D-alanine ligase [Oscillospiraceae bacterium]
MFNLCVICGGVSNEHSVSLVSGANVLRNLDTEKYHILPVVIDTAGDWFYLPGCNPDAIESGAWTEYAGKVPVTLSVSRSTPALIPLNGDTPISVDLAFPVLHGKNGEDGTIQGLFEIAGIPYVGCKVLASACGMDKAMTKLIVERLGIRQAAWCVFSAYDIQESLTACAETAERAFSYPMFVKPANAGSSVGISKAKNQEQLFDALLEAARHDGKVLVEEFISGQEVEVAVLGNRTLTVSDCGEVVSGQEFYSFDAKYNDTSSQTLIPARLEKEVRDRVRDAAKKIYLALGASGLSRVDFFVTDTMDVVFNEINTLPGFTSISMYSKLMNAAGLETRDLLDRLIALARED